MSDGNTRIIKLTRGFLGQVYKFIDVTTELL